MIPHEGARPGLRSGARAATGAGPHSCRGPLVGAAPGLMRDETGSGSWLCRPGCIRAAGLPVGRAAATTHLDAARLERGRPRPRTRPTAQAARRAYRLARSAPFYRRIRIDEGDRATLSPTRDHPGLTPGAALLPTQAGLVQGTPNRKGADLTQSIIRLAQGSLQQAQGPGGRAVPLAHERARPFGQNALLRVSPIADPRATSVARRRGPEPAAVEAAHPGRNGLGVPSSDPVSGRRVARPIRNGQQGAGTLDLCGGGGGRGGPGGRAPRPPPPG